MTERQRVGSSRWQVQRQRMNDGRQLKDGDNNNNDNNNNDNVMYNAINSPKQQIRSQQAVWKKNVFKGKGVKVKHNTYIAPQAATAAAVALYVTGQGGRAAYMYYYIYLSRRDERLSWPGWLTHGGHFTHEVVTCQLQIRRRSGKVRQSKTDVLTTEPRRRAVFSFFLKGPLRSIRHPFYRMQQTTNVQALWPSCLIL